MMSDEDRDMDRVLPAPITEVDDVKDGRMDTCSLGMMLGGLGGESTGYPSS